MRNGPLLRVLAAAAVAGVLAVAHAAPAEAGYACVRVKSDYDVHIDAADPAVGRDDETISKDNQGYCVGKKNESFTLKLREVDADDNAGDALCEISIGADKRVWIDAKGTVEAPDCTTYSFDVTFSGVIAYWMRSYIDFPIEMVGDPDDSDDSPAWCVYNYASYSSNQATLTWCGSLDY